MSWFYSSEGPYVPPSEKDLNKSQKGYFFTGLFTGIALGMTLYSGISVLEHYISKPKNTSSVQQLESKSIDTKVEK